MMQTPDSMESKLLRDTFLRDGVVKLSALLAPDDLAGAHSCYNWSLTHLGPHGSGTSFVSSKGSATFEDKANPDAPGVYAPWLYATGLTKAALALWGDSRQAWFMYEQVFMKRGASRRTCWHQDSSYLAIDGQHLIVFWICFDAVAESESLEFVRGSHKGPLYNGSTFNEVDPTEPLYKSGNLPRLPDVDATPDAFDLVSYGIEPGDVIAFHPQTLHGGAATHAGAKRETLSIRLFGDDAVFAHRPGPCGPRVAGLHDALKPGEPFRYPAFVALT
jgi:hypothetical protein